MASTSSQESQAGKTGTTTRQTRSQAQKNASSTAGGEQLRPEARDFIAKGPEIPEDVDFLRTFVGEMPARIPREEIDARMNELNK
ncbi:hypothetical protein ACJ73_03638 [Blastomyces percursus]|uniref:Uncharacterized protein n=1 Tax=Blastomyces percursus TaxID=1658174 RepID=A0A1J9Q944_9EURO|nr:hypothetical protein ACJ73_03638 [Blastomyces percursus]